MQEALLAAAVQWPADGLPDEPAGLADHRRVAPADRRAAQRRGPATARGPDVRARSPRSAFGVAAPERRRAGRDDDTLTPAVPVLPSRAVAGVAARAHAARGRRADHGRSPAPSSSPRRRWRSASAAPSSASRDAGAPFALPPEPERDDRLRVVLHVLYLMFNEGYTATSGPELVRAELTQRGDPAHARRCTGSARRRRGRGPARADAAHRRAPRRTDRPPTARSSRSPSRTAAAGTAEQIAEGVALVTHTLADRAARPVPDAGRDRRGPRRSAERRGHRLARRSSRSTSCSSASRRTRWSR